MSEYIDSFVTNKSIIDIIIEALNTDGGHHKQWYLDQILRKLISKEEYFKYKNDENYGWEDGIAP